MESVFGDLAIAGWRWLKNGLFPVYCFFCEAEGWQFCPDCHKNQTIVPAEAVCPFCRTTNSEGKTCESCAEKTFLNGALSLGFYHDKILRGFLQNWKFNGDRAAGAALTEWLSLWPLAELLPPVEWFVTAIPLHEKRQRERGFNQAEVLAKAVAREIQAEYFDLLSRREWTEAQARRSADERQVGDLDEIFETIGPVPPCVLLCDDVFTSGATIDSAAKTLKEAGAQIVWGFTLLRADS
jgi:ComF family protein